MRALVLRRLPVGVVGVAGAVLLAAFLSCAVSCADDASDAEARPIRVAAAASLVDLLDDLEVAWAAGHPEPLEVNLAGSNVLARQIEAADSADLFLSADERWVDVLDDAGRVAGDGRRALWGNRMVLVARIDSPLTVASLDDLPGASFRHLALADPEAVPAGRYARAHLEAADVWTALERRLVPTLDVRAALALVASDPEIVGLIYRTDARASDDVRVLLELEPVVPIRYVAAVIVREHDGDHEAATRRFLQFLDGDVARAIAARHGFESLGETR